MSDSIQITVCGECVRAGRGCFEPEFESHGDGSSIHRCPTCGAVVMIHLSQGTLDLNLERDQMTGVENDFRVFSEVFESSPSLGHVTASGGFCAPAFDYALPPPVKIERHLEPWWARPLLRLIGQRTFWEEAVFYYNEPLWKSLPAFTAARGGISYESP